MDRPDNSGGLTQPQIRHRRSEYRRQMARLRRDLQVVQGLLRGLQEACNHPSATKAKRGDKEVIVDCPDCGYVE